MYRLKFPSCSRNSKVIFLKQKLIISFPDLNCWMVVYIKEGKIQTHWQDQQGHVGFSPPSGIFFNLVLSHPKLQLIIMICTVRPLLIWSLPPGSPPPSPISPPLCTLFVLSQFWRLTLDIISPKKAQNCTSKYFLALHTAPGADFSKTGLWHFILSVMMIVGLNYEAY